MSNRGRYLDADGGANEDEEDWMEHYGTSLPNVREEDVGEGDSPDQQYRLSLDRKRKDPEARKLDL